MTGPSDTPREPCPHSWAPDPAYPDTRWRCSWPADHHPDRVGPDRQHQTFVVLTAGPVDFPVINVMAAWTEKEAPDWSEWAPARPLEIKDPLRDLSL